jgi:hypothetical protein
MKSVHYQNVGFPRSGTTWLWKSLINNPKIFKSNNFVKTRNFVINNKEPRFKKWTTEHIENRIPKDTTPIIEKYREYDISMCFNAFDFLCNKEEISRIESYTTHVSLTLRNPFETVSNFHAYTRIVLPEGEQSKYTVDYLIDKFDFANTVEKWLLFKNKFKILVYDDLLKDSNNYYKEVCDFIGVESNNCIPEKNVNSIVTPEYKPIIFTDEQTIKLNSHIDKLSDLIKRDFTHWKVK